MQKAWFTDKDITTIRRIVPATGDAASPASTPAASAVASLTLRRLRCDERDRRNPSGLSQSAALKATAMLTTYGADVGLYSASSRLLRLVLGRDLAEQPARLLRPDRHDGTAGASSSSSSSAQQIIAARAALLGATA